MIDVVLRRLDEPGACRVCSHDDTLRADRAVSHLTDDVGPVHLCCARLPVGVTACPSCRAAQAAEDDWQRRGKRRSAQRAAAAARIVAAE